MTKVYTDSPSDMISISTEKSSSSTTTSCNDSVVVLTVWKKSLLFNCEGFTVFDGVGNLVYRVDNYMSRNKGQISLMDASGNCVLTIRRKIKLSLGDTWLVYEGESSENPKYSVRKNTSLLNTKCLAHINSVTNQLHDKDSLIPGTKKNHASLYEVEGSYSQRSCMMYDGNKRNVASIKQKETSVKGVVFGLDVFHLIVQPGFDSASAMAIVILLDQMFGSSSSSMRRLRLSNSYS